MILKIDYGTVKIQKSIWNLWRHKITLS